MKCPCLATAPRKCGQPDHPSGLCHWCARVRSCRRDHLGNAISAIWRGTWRRAGHPKHTSRLGYDTALVPMWLGQ